MASHTDWINEVMDDEQYKEEYKVAVQRMPNGAVIEHPDNYKPEYDSLAFDAMSHRSGCLTHVCVVLRCTKPTLLRWQKRHPTLRNAIESGRMIGEKLCREYLDEISNRPAAQVNTGIIKLVVGNVHGFREEPTTVINNHNEQTTQVQGETCNVYADALEKIND